MFGSNLLCVWIKPFGSNLSSVLDLSFHVFGSNLLGLSFHMFGSNFLDLTFHEFGSQSSSPLSPPPCVRNQRFLSEEAAHVQHAHRKAFSGLWRRPALVTTMCISGKTSVSDVGVIRLLVLHTCRSESEAQLRHPARSALWHAALLCGN